MPSNNARNLTLSISADVSTFSKALKAGKLSLTEFAGDVSQQIEAVEANFRKLGGANADATARDIEASFKKSFSNVRAAAEESLKLPRTESGSLSINLIGARQAAADSEALAVAYREIADAAAKVVVGNDAATAAEKRNAVTAEARALAAREVAGADRQELAALESLQGALVAGGASSLVAANAAEKVAGAHGRVSTSGLIMQHVLRSTGDSFAAGLPVTTIFAEQIGRVGEAAALAGPEGSLGKYAAFLTGGWGLALTLGVSVLAPLVIKLIEQKDATEEALDKLKEHARETQASAAAQEQFAKTAEGVAEAIDDQNKALEKNITSQTTATDAALRHARAEQADELKIRAKTESLLEQAEAELKAQQAALGTGGITDASGAAGAGFAASAAADKVTAAQKAVEASKAKLAKAERNIRLAQVGVAEQDAKAAVDPLVRINQQYDRMADAAKAAAAGNNVLAASIGKTLIGIETQRKAALKAEQDRESASRRSATDNRQVGRQITVGDATAIIQGIGGRVTSGQRSTAEQAQLYAKYQAGTGSLAAKPGTSLHESGQAVDVAKTAGITIAAIKKAFEAEGVHITELLDEGNHFHVGFGAKGPSAETLAKRQQAGVRKDAGDDAAYQGQLRQADDDILRANADLANTTEARSAAALDRLQSDLGARDKALQDQVTAGKLTQVEADTLKVKLGSAEYEQELIEQRKAQSETIARQTERDQIRLQGSAALLQLEATLATTTRQRRDIALRQLDNEEAQARLGLNATLADPSATPEQIANAHTRIGQIDEQHAPRVAAIDRDNAGPLADYRTQLQRSAGDTNEALQGVAVDGLKGLEDGLTGLISGTETVAGAFKKMAASIIADLARIAIEKAILGALGGSFFGFSDGGEVQAHADGGHIHGPGTGRSDSILSWLSNGEFVISAAATAKHLPLLHAINDNRLPAFADGGLIGTRPRLADLSPREIASVSRSSRGQGAVTFDLRGAVMTQDLLAQMNTISARHAMGAVIGGARQAAEDRHDDAYSAIPQ